MEPSDQNCSETSNEGKENNCNERKGKENVSMDMFKLEKNILKRRNVPVSSLSDEEKEELAAAKEEEEEFPTNETKKIKPNLIDESLERPFFDTVPRGSTGAKLSGFPSSSDLAESKGETYNLPSMKIQPILGGKPLLFPVHPRLTLIDLKDFILFSLNIPHPQQILSFYDETDKKVTLLSNYSENTLLCTVPGLIDEITGRCALVSLTFKMSSGMDFSINPSDVEYENSINTSDNEGYFEINGIGEGASDNNSSKISSLASTLASIIPFPPGITKSSKMLIRSLSKSSPTNSNLPTLWEIFFPESGIKMMVTALINVNEVKSEDENENKEIFEGKNDEKQAVKIDTETNEPLTVNNLNSINNSNTLALKATPALVITPPDEFKEKVQIKSEIPPSEPSTTNDSSPKTNCEKCRVRCRPALRFICKCNKTFCQSHRYPDKHDCTFDHRADDMATIQANNPKIVKDKVGNF